MKPLRWPPWLSLCAAVVTAFGPLLAEVPQKLILKLKGSFSVFNPVPRAKTLACVPSGGALQEVQAPQRLEALVRANVRFALSFLLV